MYFQHAKGIWSDHPELVAGVVFATGITGDASVGPRIAEFGTIADARLASSSEAEFPEIQAWRRAFSRMGLKPTQYRSAAESLLRRFKRERGLPQIHPLIDLCNAISLAFAIPVAVFDVDKIAENLEVRYASGDESFLTFSGETENPDAHEVIFALEGAHMPGDGQIGRVASRPFGTRRLRSWSSRRRCMVRRPPTSRDLRPPSRTNCTTSGRSRRKPRC
jgi:DNA/RNA-binding domain of Phe-tRNA-synthetase-like protein